MLPCPSFLPMDWIGWKKTWTLVLFRLSSWALTWLDCPYCKPLLRPQKSKSCPSNPLESVSTGELIVGPRRTRQGRLSRLDRSAGPLSMNHPLTLAWLLFALSSLPLACLLDCAVGNVLYSTPGCLESGSRTHSRERLGLNWVITRDWQRIRWLHSFFLSCCLLLSASRAGQSHSIIVTRACPVMWRCFGVAVGAAILAC